MAKKNKKKSVNSFSSPKKQHSRQKNPSRNTRLSSKDTNNKVQALCRLLPSGIMQEILAHQMIPTAMFAMTVNAINK